MKLEKWKCEIIIPVDEDNPTPHGFDGPPRQAAIQAIEEYGYEVLLCSSGWGNPITEEDKEWIVSQLRAQKRELLEDIVAMRGSSELIEEEITMVLAS